MIKERLVRIQPGRNASRPGNHLLRAFPSITPLFTLLGCWPLLKNIDEAVEAEDLISARHLGLRLDALDCVLVGAVGGKNSEKPGCVERLSDWIQDTVQGVVGNRFLKPAQHQLAVRATETLGCKDKHAQARAADIIELCNIDDEAAVARIYSGLYRSKCYSWLS